MAVLAMDGRKWLRVASCCDVDIALGLRMLFRSTLFFILQAIVGSALASDEQESISIPPLSIQAPAGDSWQMSRKTEFGVVFHRVLVESGGHSMAYVNTFYVHSPDNAAAFQAEVKANVATFFRAPNARVVGTTFHPTNERGYSCVVVRATIQVVETEPSPPAPAPSTRQARVLLCREPGKQPLGFAVGFTYTAPDPTAAGESEADAFMNGVRLVRR
jgi:hypothetical protein